MQLSFLDQLEYFWECQGSSLKVPKLDGRAIDLSVLHKHVQDEGGETIVTRERKWPRIAALMGFSSGRGVGTLLRFYYETILHPYDVFQTGQS